MSENLVSVRGLSLSYERGLVSIPVLHDVSFEVGSGRTLGIVGESGSGKSTVGLSILGLLPESARIPAGSIFFNDRDLLKLDAAHKRELRGARISMVFQDPFTSLNPGMTIGRQVAETLVFHRGLDQRAAEQKALELLRKVRIPAPEAVMCAYPHQLSGGMKQRVMIASALSCSPQLLILDEPTTALDVTTEAAILDLLRALRDEYDLSIIFISHNLDVVSRFCDDLCVLYAGSVVETGAVAEIFVNPRHPYTKGLIAAVPKLGADRGRLPVIPGRLPTSGTREQSCIFKPRCAFSEARCSEPQQLDLVETGGRVRCWKSDLLVDSQWPLPAFAAISPSDYSSAKPILAVRRLSKAFELGGSLFLDQMPAALKRLLGSTTREVRALNDVSIEVKRGEILGVLGESGSGKSTLARCIVGLIRPSAGEIMISPGNEPVEVEQKKQASIVQMVFQNPSSSLNPRRRVGEILDRPLFLSKYGNAQKRSERVHELLDLVRLPATFAERYPRQLSGGERQRVGIARALAMSPDLIICDEALSALDVSVQAAVINLLLDLRAELGVGYLFISHDISVVGHIADRIAVMFGGCIVEEGSADEVLTGPSHPYTAELIRAACDHGSVPAREVPIAEHGCVFQFRCSSYMAGLCDKVAPQLRQVGASLRIACHLENDRLPLVRTPKVATSTPAQDGEKFSLGAIA